MDERAPVPGTGRCQRPGTCRVHSERVFPVALRLVDGGIGCAIDNDIGGVPRERRLDRGRVGYIELRPRRADEPSALRPSCPHDFQAHLTAVPEHENLQDTPNPWLSLIEL